MKGILFKPELIKAILDGRKTTTRRIINQQAPKGCVFIGVREHYGIGKIGFYWSDGTTGNMQGFWPSFNKDLFPKYQPREIIYVKETFEIVSVAGSIYKNDPPTLKIKSKADGGESFNRWQSPLFMPEKAARIFLRITDIRVERLQDISEKDAKSEGVKSCKWFGINEDISSFRNGFFSKWIDINGTESYNKNPWVWAYTFEKVQL